MYGGKGAGPVAAGAVILPNTGGNHLLLVASIVSIMTGGVILLSSLARFVAKQAYKA
jgi:hypothetical protein